MPACNPAGTGILRTKVDILQTHGKLPRHGRKASQTATLRQRGSAAGQPSSNHHRQRISPSSIPIRTIRRRHPRTIRSRSPRNRPGEKPATFRLNIPFRVGNAPIAAWASGSAGQRSCVQGEAYVSDSPPLIPRTGPRAGNQRSAVALPAAVKSKQGGQHGHATSRKWLSQKAFPKNNFFCQREKGGGFERYPRSASKPQGVHRGSAAALCGQPFPRPTFARPPETERSSVRGQFALALSPTPIMPTTQAGRFECT